MIEELLTLNKAYAFARQASEAELPMTPSRALAVVTCMDARIPLEKVLGLGNGEAHVIRNAGAIVTDDVIRSLLISQQALGTNRVLLIGHTECGMLTLSGKAGDDFVADAERKAGRSLPGSLGGFYDLKQAIDDGVKKIENSPFVSGDVSGLIYNVRTGLLAST